MVARSRFRLTPILWPRPVSPRESAPSPTLKMPLLHGHVCLDDIVFSSHTWMFDGDRPGFLFGLSRPRAFAYVSRIAMPTSASAVRIDRKNVYSEMARIDDLRGTHPCFNTSTLSSRSVRSLVVETRFVLPHLISPHLASLVCSRIMVSILHASRPARDRTWSTARCDRYICANAHSIDSRLPRKFRASLT